MINPNDIPVNDLTQAQYLSLTGREKHAVDILLSNISRGAVHELTSLNDLTPSQLVIEIERMLS